MVSFLLLSFSLLKCQGESCLPFISIPTKHSRVPSSGAEQSSITFSEQLCSDEATEHTILKLNSTTKHLEQVCGIIHLNNNFLLQFQFSYLRIYSYSNIFIIKHSVTSLHIKELVHLKNTVIINLHVVPNFVFIIC